MSGVHIQPNSQNLVKRKKISPEKKDGEKISQGNDDKEGIKRKRGKMREKTGKKREAVEKRGIYNGFQ